MSDSPAELPSAPAKLKAGSLHWLQVAALGIAIAISGNVSGWNYGLGVGGWGGMLLAALAMAVFLNGMSEADLVKSQRGPGVKKYLNERGFRILAALDQVGEKYHSSPARVALGWLVARQSITAPIASATNLDQLNDLAEGVKLELDHSSIALLDDASQ